MGLSKYKLTDYEEYLLKRMGTENVVFDDGVVYASFYRESNTTQLMKTADDEFVSLYIESDGQMKSLQVNDADDSSELLDDTKFSIDSTENDKFEKLFYT